MTAVVVRYLAQLRQLAGRADDRLTLAGPCTVADLVRRLASSDDRLRHVLLDDRGEVRGSILIFIGDDQADRNCLVNDGDEITLMTPIAGGAS